MNTMDKMSTRYSTSQGNDSRSCSLSFLRQGKEGVRIMRPFNLKYILKMGNTEIQNDMHTDMLRLTTTTTTT
jgi:hypothetical protein